MSDARTARARLERLLHVLPAACRPGGAALAELARTLDAPEERILEDIEEVTARAYYHPGGWPDDVQILFESDRVRVLRAAGLDRPAKLSPLETLCLALALRGPAATAFLADAAGREALLERAETHLAALLSGPEDDGVFAASERAPDPDGLRELLIAAAGEHRECAIHYVKPGAPEGSVRMIHPYAVAYGEGCWYVIGHCAVEDGVRIFRLDRILDADVSESVFPPPTDFRVTDYLDNGRVYRAGSDRRVRIRYSAQVARWIRERAAWESHELEECEDGSVVVSHPVADPWWAVAQALQYGAEAEILEPEDVRGMVCDVAAELAGIAEA